MDAFGGGSGSESEQDDDEWDDDRQIVSAQEPASARGRFFGNSTTAEYVPLEDTTSAGFTGASEPNLATDPVSTSAFPSSASLPASAARQSAPPRTGLLSMLPWGSAWRAQALRRANQNDGVFANLTAKPEAGGPGGIGGGSDEFPPTYEEAAADQTPPYWETTILTPGFGDEVYLDGLPVGSPLNFIWNMIVSSAFQFVGFLLTYLLHTSHAAKHGSRAGLGFTLFQYGFYLQPNAAGDAGAPAREFEPSKPNSYEMEGLGKDMAGTFHQGTPSTSTGSSSNSASGSTALTSGGGPSGWISVFLMVLGAIMVLRAVVEYLRARKMELVIQGPSSVGAVVAMAGDHDEDESEDEHEHQVRSMV